MRPLLLAAASVFAGDGPAAASVAAIHGQTLSCDAALELACGSSRVQPPVPFACSDCAGEASSTLRAAGCENDGIARWCSGLSTGTVAVFLTTADRAHLFEQLPSLTLGAASPTPTIEVEPATAYQKIVGFGAAITDAAAWVLSTSEPFDKLMELLFAPHTRGGISLGMLRVPMGVSDFSRSYAMGNLTYADTYNVSSHAICSCL